MRTARPLTAGATLPALETILGSVGAALVRADGLYRVVPAATAGGAGALVVPLNYVSADDLAKVLQPLRRRQREGRCRAGSEHLLISGDPGQVQSLTALVRSFDTDALAGQSYAVLPVASGNAKDFADAMTASFHGKGGSSLGGLVRVVPLPRMNAVLVISPQPSYIEAARRRFRSDRTATAYHGAGLARVLPAEQQRERHRVHAANGLHAQQCHRGAAGGDAATAPARWLRGRGGIGSGTTARRWAAGGLRAAESAGRRGLGLGS